MKQHLFKSFFSGGFECATHRSTPRRGERIDMVAATRHDEFASQDYERLQEVGIRTARDGLRWHLIEESLGRYEWSSLLPILRAARDTNTQVIWDLCHYGYPDHLDIFAPEFVKSFAQLARRFAELLKAETDEQVPLISPMNEISYFAWGGGGIAWLNPMVEGRANELKAQLVRATIEGIEAFWSVFPKTRIVHCDPAINVIPDPKRPRTKVIARSVHASQYEAWDMIGGYAQPALGGHPKYLDIVGVNFYWNNQWTLGRAPTYPRTTVVRGDPRYRPFSLVLREVYERYRRPLFVAETGIEDDARPEWLNYISDEVYQAMTTLELPVEGICLYPIVNHPGWDDDRHCYDGLWDYPDDNGHRETYEPLARELAAQQQRFRELRGEKGTHGER